jgi:hypothetical protein
MNSMLFMVMGGVAFVSVMVLAVSLMGGRRKDAVSKSIFAWLVGAGVNAAINLSNGAAPLVDEMAAFAVIFGIPAAVAYGLSFLVKA